MDQIKLQQRIGVQGWWARGVDAEYSDATLVKETSAEFPVDTCSERRPVAELLQGKRHVAEYCLHSNYLPWRLISQRGTLSSQYT